MSLLNSSKNSNLCLDRDNISYKYLQGHGIEIGALHNPLPVKEGVQVSYVDRLPLSELEKQYPELSEYSLNRVDIVDDGEVLDSIEDNSLDFIIANHFLEHCENPIGTIGNHLKKLKKNGILYYALPDKWCTFDKNRPLTDFSHLLADHLEGPGLSREQHFTEWVTLVENYHDTEQIKTGFSSSQE